MTRGQGSFDFDPSRHEAELAALIADIDAAETLDDATWGRLLRRHPRNGDSFFSKSEIVRGFRHLNRVRDWQRDENEFLERVRMKPVRTLSGVAPVTVLTKPYPCPGKCIFCPSDVRMPKSYLSNEPGAQRAAEHRFDPYRQTASRLRTLYDNGHPVNKVELIVLGGTWSYYPSGYQRWFIRRCFEAMNAFDGRRVEMPERPGAAWEKDQRRVEGIDLEAGTYNQLVRRGNQLIREGATENGDGDSQTATWDDLDAAQRRNETASSRCVGLVLETRPDHLDDAEIVRLRRLGATKVQIGFQSLDDAVLEGNRRGHDVEATRAAMRRLRGAGFKLHAHWMPNLYGSSPEADIDDFERIFADADFRPDELKIYPCSLIESAELMAYYRDGRWRPYDERELLDVLTACIAATPRYCRLTRVIRDIPGGDIVDGNKTTNLREVAERELDRRGVCRLEIRSRETRGQRLDRDSLKLRETAYTTSTGREHFLEWTTDDDAIAGFLRLSLPSAPVAIDEIGAGAMIREVHVYGQALDWHASGGGKAQHRGLGTALVDRAAEIAVEAGYSDLAVISSVGTREYYRKLGFEDGELYQHLKVISDGGDG